MTKLGTALEHILLDRTGRTGLHEVLAKFALPVKDIDTSIVTTMFTTLLAQGGLSSADSSGIGYASPSNIPHAKSIIYPYFLRRYTNFSSKPVTGA
jgi:hypothetical protein